jgi:acyl carrier protein
MAHSPTPDAEIFNRTTAVIAEVLERPGLTLTETTTAKDVEGWDSFRQIEILLSLEQAFGIKFSSAEMDSLGNVGDLVRAVAARAGR